MNEPGTALTPYVRLREELEPLKSDFGHLLPSHIPADKFAQVCFTAVERDPDLLGADRQSLKIACMNAATDGLLPDKREGAFVIFNTEVDRRPEGKTEGAVVKVKVKLVQWMPMITGILKKAHQSGKVAGIAIELVYEHDVYERAAGDDAVIIHKPLDFGDRGKVRGGYAIIRMRDGAPHHEVMSLQQIEAVRAVSRAGQNAKSPWVTFWDEMAKKTILRRALKRVPLSEEVDRVLARDDVFYNIEAERTAPALAAPGRAVPRRALFADRPYKAPEIPADATPAPLSAEPSQDPLAAQAAGGLEAGADGGGASAEGDPPATEHSTAVIAFVTRVRHVTSLGELATAIHEATEDPELQDCSDEERGWMEEVVAAREIELKPPAGEEAEYERGRQEWAEAPGLVLKLSSDKPEKVYRDEEKHLWLSDLLTKLAATTGKTREAVWKVNLPHVLHAKTKGYDHEAGRALEVAAERGLPTGQASAYLGEDTREPPFDPSKREG